MKLSWKLFFITTPIFILFLTVFGSWMLQESFQESLNQEVERCMVENQMFQNSYELTFHSLSEQQREQTSVQRVVESFYKKQKNGGNARIYSLRGEVLYQQNSLQVANRIREALDEENNVGYEIVRQQDHVYVVVLARSSFDVFVETIRNITAVFENRTAMYFRYRTAALAVTILTGGLILLVLFLVMRNMEKLSSATRQFAMGQYDTRVVIRSSDEIGRLAEDFNWMADAMKVQMERLEGEARRQEEFTAAFAHELKTPLTSIIGYADTIRQMELTQEETDMCADYIYRQGKRLQSLSYKLLDMTMTDRRDFDYRPLSAPEFLEEIEKTVRKALEEKQLVLELQAEKGMIYGDQELLSSVFINLIDNARKASAPGGIIRVTGAAAPGGYFIVVEDQGEGIPKEEVSKITEAFYMVDKSRSRKEGGAGLGLALCRKILELHGAGWKIESAVGKGTKVTVQFGVWENSGSRARRNRRERKRSR
ncbi:MAG: HAMP domain-containing sensor histidine kinase [Lachnospiraceae bacterium]|nr:HAMP domain-containing sensor histidine kinase [Lachnospiraceae bacterium]